MEFTLAWSQPLVWMDLEMSGLDPDRDRILEIAVVLTDGQLVEIEEGPDIVIHQTDDVLAAMDAWNIQHHGESGLSALVRASETEVSVAEQTVLHWLRERCPPAVAPLAGNSVHQDRAFLRRWMPELHDFLHYRNVDVSTVKELMRRWNPQVLSSAPQKAGGHRALDDIRESILELLHYRRTAFLPRT
jgi:oligoribonuclease